MRSPDGGSLRVMESDPARETRKLHNLIGVQLQTSPILFDAPAPANWPGFILTCFLD